MSEPSSTFLDQPPLAIVIPAYKTRHLRETLESLARQTDQRFTLYVGDDASPEPVGDCVREYESRIRLRYKRFAENLGGKSLIEHWARCIALTEGEPWLWLFSDDDTLETDCVSAFYCAIARPDTPDLLRFPLEIIDEKGVFQCEPPTHPWFEREAELLRALLMDRQRQWRAPDHVFTRRAYERLGGFVDLPRGMYSDYATWLKFSSLSGVRSILGAKVRWRTHSQSISTSTFGTGNRVRFQATMGYLRWLADWARQRPDLQPVFSTWAPIAFPQELGFYSPPCTARECVHAWRELSTVFAVAGHARRPVLALRVAAAWIAAHLRHCPLRQRIRAWRRRMTA